MDGPSVADAGSATTNIQQVNTIQNVYLIVDMVESADNPSTVTISDNTLFNSSDCSAISDCSSKAENLSGLNEEALVLQCQKCCKEFTAATLEVHTCNKGHQENDSANQKPEELVRPVEETSNTNAKPRKYVCSFCGKRFLKNDHLEAHSRIHTGDKPYECKHCCRQFKTKSNMIRHINVTHLFQKAYKCVLCDQNFSSATHLKHHLMRKHTTERPYKCQHCEKKYCTKGEMQDHIQGVHEKKRLHICKLCGTGFVYRRNLARHQRTHSKKDPLEQEHGPKVQAEKNTITISKNISPEKEILKDVEEDCLPESVSKRKPYECEFCGKKLLKSDHLKMHIRIHTGETPFQCDLCSRSFNTKSSLTRHQRIHSGERPWKCEHCHQTFGTSGQRTVHVRRVHTGDKPYKCEHCSKGFSTKDCLVVHIRSHTGEKPYNCMKCDQSFVRKQNMLRHMSTVHPSADQSCALVYE